MTGATIEIEDVTIHLAGRVVVDAVTLSIPASARVAVMGPSGAGKSTLVRAMVGLEPLARGRIRIDGVIANDGPRVLVPPEARGAGMVFQDLALWPHLTVAAHLEFVLAAAGVPRSDRAARIATAFDEVGITALATRLPHQLSGGEQQRVAIARALITRPRILVLDEPLTNLDAVRRPEIRTLVRSLATGTTSLHVTHDPHHVAGDVDRVIVLERGQISQDASPADLAAAPATAFVAAIAGGLVTP